MRDLARHQDTARRRKEFPQTVEVKTRSLRKLRPPPWLKFPVGIAGMLHLATTIHPSIHLAQLSLEEGSVTLWESQQSRTI